MFHWWLSRSASNLTRQPHLFSMRISSVHRVGWVHWPQVKNQCCVFVYSVLKMYTSMYLPYHSILAMYFCYCTSYVLNVLCQRTVVLCQRTVFNSNCLLNAQNSKSTTLLVLKRQVMITMMMMEKQIIIIQWLSDLLDLIHHTIIYSWFDFGTGRKRNRCWKSSEHQMLVWAGLIMHLFLWLVC